MPAHCCTWSIFASYHKHNLTYNMVAYNLVTIDREFSDVTVPYLYTLLLHAPLTMLQLLQ